MRRHCEASSTRLAFGKMRRPTATTVSAARMKEPRSSSSSWIDFSAASALARASRLAQARGNSPRRGVSSTSAGRSASGSMPAWLSNDRRRGEPEARTNLGRPSIWNFMDYRESEGIGARGTYLTGLCFTTSDKPLSCLQKTVVIAADEPFSHAGHRHPGKAAADAHRQGIADLAIGGQFLLAAALGTGGVR